MKNYNDVHACLKRTASFSLHFEHKMKIINCTEKPHKQNEIKLRNETSKKNYASIVVPVAKIRKTIDLPLNTFTVFYSMYSMGKSTR